MITNIWLRSQPKKKIVYPDCFPIIQSRSKQIWIYNSETTKDDANYWFDDIVRIEFRP